MARQPASRPRSAAGAPRPPRITELRVENYRALRNLRLKEITPLTVLLGPNGSGKSTIFDVLAFLSECFEGGLRRAWDRRGKARELRSRGSEGAVVIELKYQEADYPLITYHLAVDERQGNVYVAEEWLHWTRGGGSGRPFRFLDYKDGKGTAIPGNTPEQNSQRIDFPLTSPDLLAVSALGQFADHPRVAALRRFITGWYVSYLSVESARGQPEAGPQDRLSRTGDNLANVIQYLGEQHPERLATIFEALRGRVPQIQKVLAEPMQDGRLLLSIKDAPFSDPILARFASDGTLKILAYLILLYDPSPPPFIGIEEPENFLHPRLLFGLAEECRGAAERGQVLVTTHSPFFLNALAPQEVRALYRDGHGYTQVVTASDVPGIREFINEGAQMGELWLEGHLGVGDPLTGKGTSVRPPSPSP